MFDVAGTTPTLEIHERPGRAEATATVRGARGDIGAAFDRLLWLAGAALALTASAALMERVGMRREGHQVESFWSKDEWTDELLYAILAREWRARDETGQPGMPQ